MFEQDVMICWIFGRIHIVYVEMAIISLVNEYLMKISTSFVLNTVLHHLNNASKIAYYVLILSLFSLHKYERRILQIVPIPSASPPGTDKSPPVHPGFLA